jgi:radical SAM protein with 4Fe4S-binding SPASM domain
MERSNISSEYTLQEVCVEILGYCPMNCMHCSSFTPLAHRELLHVETIRALIDDIALFGTPIVQLSGGEPLYHPGLVEIIEYTTKAGLVACLYTSGITTVDGNLAPVPKRLVKSLKLAGLRKVVVSLQGATSSVHEAINRTPGTFERTLESVRRFKELGLWVGVHFVPMRPNWKDVVSLAEMCAHLQVDELAILRFVPQGRGSANQSHLGLFEEFSELLSTLQEMRRTFSDRIHIRIGSPLNFCSFYPVLEREGGFGCPVPCSAGISSCTILPTGDVVPCPALKHQTTEVAGNVLHEPFAAIWSRSPVFSELRAFDYRKLTGPCHSCEFLSACRGRCLAQRIIAWGDMYQGPDPSCPVCDSLPEDLFTSHHSLDVEERFLTTSAR